METQSFPITEWLIHLLICMASHVQGDRDILDQPGFEPRPPLIPGMMNWTMAAAG